MLISSLITSSNVLIGLNVLTASIDVGADLSLTTSLQTPVDKS
jgi:hypothetical protein